MSISALIIDDEQLARDELKYLLDSVGGVDVVAQGANGIEAVNLIEEYQPDLVFLDVQMPGLDGFAVLQRLVERSRLRNGGKNGDLPQIVFATAYDQYAVRAFDVNAVDYLLKPFERKRVSEAVERARLRVTAGTGAAVDDPLLAPADDAQPTGTQSLRSRSTGSQSAGSQPTSSQPTSSQIDQLLRLLNRSHSSERATQPAKLVVQAQSRLLLVDQSEICFAAIEEGVIRIVTRNFEGQSKCRTLEELQELLDPSHFWRAHRGYVVNINHIREVVPWFKSSYQLRMNDKQQTEVPVSRAQTKRLRELFNL
jgi:two-component system LytT family response regulator/two-component system response regulator LytT